jgi:acetolactate synthase I/II/III large subunit
LKNARSRRRRERPFNHTHPSFSANAMTVHDDGAVHTRMIKLSDYVVDTLVQSGIDDIFLVSGGNIMHMLDSVGRHPGMRYICNYHEQASAIAAEAWARIKGRPGACLVTTGPGSANALSGVVGAWFDSIPLIVLSGQARVPLLADYSKHRQLGPQEMNTLPMVRPVTKFAAQIRDPQTIGAQLEAALRASVSGRPGPVWLDLPLDVQAAQLEQAAVAKRTERPQKPPGLSSTLRAQIEATADGLRRAQRPVLVLGAGVRLAHAADQLLQLLEKIRVPVLLPIGAMDLIPETSPLHLGPFGPFGRRSANFALQNSDFFLSVGAGLSIAGVGFNTASFAPRAYKIIVNIDRGELEKPVLTADLAIECDAALFLSSLVHALGSYEAPARWLAACRNWRERYPPGPAADSLDPDFVNSYVLCEELSAAMEPGEIVVAGNSLDCCSVYQSFHVKERQRILINANCGAMGWDLPAAVGAAVAAGTRTVVVTGDGSILFNIQELQTIKSSRLPVKIFVLNNQGYESIRATQLNYFEGRFVGSSFGSGIGNPDFRLLAESFGLAYDRIERPLDVRNGVCRVLDADGAILCEVRVSPSQPRTPRTSSFRRSDGSLETRPLEDMFPFLNREEILTNMSMFDKDDSK